MNPISSPSPADNDDLCGVCNKLVNNSDKAILCNKCSKWIHITCNKTTTKQYKYYQKNPDEEFTCKECDKCGICNKTVAKNHHAIECNICSKWIHKKCNKLGTKDYNNFQNNEDSNFYCIKCLRETLPTLSLDNNEFDLLMKGIDVPGELDVNEIFLSNSQIEMINKINKAISNELGEPKEKNDDIDDILPIDCKYYPIKQFNDE